MTGAGEERIASLLLRHLPAEYPVELVLFNGPIDYPLPKGQSVHFLRSHSSIRALRLLSLPLLAYRYYRFCKNNKITHSLSFDSVPNFINCLLKTGTWSGQVWLREVNHPSQRFGGANWSGRIHRFLMKRWYPRADCVFVNAQRIGTDLTAHYGVAPEAIDLMVNPLDLEMIEEGKQTKQQTTRFTFIHVGAFRPQKNHQLLIDAFAMIRELGAELWLVGKGELEEEMKASVAAYGLEEQVRFLGFQANPFQFMAAADCMVLSSDFEGLPNVLLEGLACELPIISTDCLSGPREVLAPQGDYEQQLKEGMELVAHGILTPVGNKASLAAAMKRMYKDKELRLSLIGRSQKRLKEYKIHRIISNLSTKFQRH